MNGLAQVKFDMKHLFIDNAPGQMRDLETICAELKPALVLGNPGLLGAILLSEHGGPPAALLFVLPLVVGSVDAAPFGLGLGPSASPLGRLRNRALNFAVEHVLFRDVQTHWNATRGQVGLGPTGWWMNAVERVALCLQPTIPSFEYPRSDLPLNVHFVGMMPVDALPGRVPPAFWPELDGKRTVVHVFAGHNRQPRTTLIAPALAGLANEDVLVVVSTGGRPIESLKLTFRTRAQALAKEYAAHDALARSIDLIEGVTGA